MRLKYNRNIKLWIPGFGIHDPGEIIEVDEEHGKKMLETGYFDKIKKRRIKRKKSKYKGDDKLCHKEKEAMLPI